MNRERWLRVFVTVGIALLFVIPTAWLFMSGCVPAEEPVPRSSASYGWLNVEEVDVATTGAAGAAVGSGSTDAYVRGRILAVHLDYASSISSTTDITISQSTPPLDVLILTNNATDGWYYPAVEWHSSAGAGLSTYGQVYVADLLTITATQTTSGTAATVTIYWGE